MSASPAIVRPDPLAGRTSERAARIGLREGVGLGLLYSGLLALDGSLGALGSAADHTFGVLGFVAATFLLGACRGWGPWGTWRNLAGMGLLVAGYSFAVLASDPSAWLFGATAALFGMAILHANADRPARARLLKRVGWATFVFASLRFLYWTSAGVHQLAIESSEAVSRLVGSVTSVDQRFGPTAAGWSHTLLALCLVVGLTGFLRLRSRARLAWLCVPVAVHVGYSIVAGYSVSGGGGVSDVDLAATLMGGFLRWRALAEASALALSTWWAGSKATASVDRAAGTSRAWIRWAAALGASAILVTGVAVTMERASLREARPGRFLLWSTSPERYTSLLTEAYALGFQPRPIRSLDELGDTPGPGDVIAVVFPFGSIVGEETASILTALRKGAGLILVCEHTNALRCRDILGELLAEIGADLGFDSVFPLASWNRAARMAPVAHASAFHDYSATSYLVGASLDVPVRGTVLYSGRYAFGDAGDWEGMPENFLGDRSYRDGEALGDRPLVWAGPLHEGRVVLFGDGEAFTQSGIPMFRPVLERVLLYASGGGAGDPVWLLRAIGAALLVLFAVLCSSSVLGGVVALAAACTVVAATTDSLHGVRNGRPEGPVPFHAISLAHQPALGLFETSERAITGFVGTLQSHGDRVCFLDSLNREDLHGAETLFLLAPQSELTRKEAETVLDFARGGGSVVVAVSWSQRDAVDHLLEAVGVRILPLLAARGIDINLEARPDVILFREPYALQPREDHRVLHRDGDGNALVVRAPLGRGSVVVIGDPLFLLGENLVTEHSSFAANVRFLESLVREL